MTKKKVLIAYGGMVVGGSTTALLSMLKEWNFEKYDVDLILYDRGFPFEKDIPKQVHILNGRRSMPNGYMQRLKKGIQYVLSPYWIKKEWYALKYKDRRAGLHAIGQFKVKKLSCKLKEQYDIAIGYLEDWSDEFIAYNVEAAQKIMWIHLDFANVQYINKSLTERYLSKADKIVCVSVECLKNFNKLFPDLSSRSVYLPNINSSEYIKEKSLEELNDNDLMHMKNCKKFRDKGVEDCFFLLGAKMNPYPFIKQADVFCLPSRYEGKPIVVTETMMLGIPPIVTEYASAKEQIENNIDGIIVQNSDDSIAGVLEYVCKNEEILNALKTQLGAREYSNKEDIEKVYALLK